MNVTELAQKLTEQGVSEEWYSLLSGGLPNERLCLIKTETGWQVYYSEHGEKNGIKFFDTEDGACSYFYKELQHAWAIQEARQYLSKNIVEFEDCFVVLFFDDHIPVNNVSAYDYTGNRLWMIDEIIKTPTKEAYVSIGKDGENILSVQSYNGLHYLLDLSSRSVVLKEVTK